MDDGDVGFEDILHILVVGFHHKKGCQVEFVYPPLDPLPEQWKHLPSLAMPDGAHNYAHDTVYFHLPSLSPPSRTVFGVSCFQQIPLDKVKNRTEDMTRSTVQKAVCVLATAPLYGYIQIKMELITAAFFDGGDFSQTKLLEDAFQHLRECLPGSSQQHLYDGLSVRDLLGRFRHRLLVLFKLLLLEKKVVVFQSPVQPLCVNILSLVSLLPHALEFGLYDAASLSCTGSPIRTPSVKPDTNQSQLSGSQSFSTSVTSVTNQTSSGILEYSAAEDTGDGHTISNGAVEKDTVDEGTEYGIDALSNKDGLTNRTSLAVDMEKVSEMNLVDCGLPLEIFRKGNTCYPYLSISYLDHLASPAVRGFLVGATNVLFKQKRSLWEVLVEVDESRIETSCPELRWILSLTTEDLRFMESILRDFDSDQHIDEAWVQKHFHLYLATLLRTSLLPDGSREIESFNSNFVAAWRLTHNYKMWESTDHSGIMQWDPLHPGNGSLSVQDVKLKISQVMMSSESGRKINQAVANTGRAVGGAVTQARGAISGWLSSFKQENKTRAVENI